MSESSGTSKVATIVAWVMLAVGLSVFLIPFLLGSAGNGKGGSNTKEPHGTREEHHAAA